MSQHSSSSTCCLIAACGYALIAGGAPERWTAAVFLVAAFASYVRAVPKRFRHEVEVALFAIDVGDA